MGNYKLSKYNHKRCNCFKITSSLFVGVTGCLWTIEELLWWSNWYFSSEQRSKFQSTCIYATTRKLTDVAGTIAVRNKCKFNWETLKAMANNMMVLSTKPTIEVRKRNNSVFDRPDYQHDVGCWQEWGLMKVQAALTQTSLILQHSPSPGNDGSKIFT